MGSSHPYAEAGPLTLADRRVIGPSIAAIQGANYALMFNLPLSRKIAAVLKAKEVRPDNLDADFLKVVNECRRVIGPAA